MRRWGWWAALGAVLVVAAVIALVRSGGVAIQVAEVRRGEIHEFIDERGTTRVPRVYRITMPQAGRIEEIALAAGSVVQQGQIVARIVEEDLENEVAEARAAVERLEAAIVENDNVAVERSLALQAAQFVASMTTTVEAAKAQMEVSGKRSEFAETNLGRAQELRRTAATSQEDLDRAQLHYWEGQLGFRQDTLIVEAMKSIRAATALLPQMVQDYIAHKNLTRAVLEKQKSEAQARLRQILTRRDRGTMRSPVDGVVLERLVEDEQFLPSGTELLTIGQLDQLEVESDVLSEDVVRVQPGDDVEVYGPAVGAPLGAGVPASVHQIHPAGFTKMSSLGVEQQRVRVVIRFAPEWAQTLREREVGADYSVRVRIFTDQESATLIVPRSALFRGPDGGWQLFVVRASRARLQPVQVGLINDTSVEVTDGLRDGELVILAPDAKLTDAVRVRVLAR
jgi:HlyD family secretion protein